LQLAGGAKLRPAGAGFGETPYESTNYNSIAEDSGRPGADVRWGFAITSIFQIFEIAPDFYILPSL
jgi:hypothetical protein